MFGFLFWKNKIMIDGIIWWKFLILCGIFAGLMFAFYKMDQASAAVDKYEDQMDREENV